MDQAVAAIRGTQDLPSLQKQLESKLEAMKKGHQGYASALATLDLKAHSMGACYILFARAAATERQKCDTGFLELVENFVVSMDKEQIRGHCAQRFGQVIHRYAEGCRPTPGRGLPHVLQALKEIRPHPDYLTPMHSDYICLCLLVQQYTLAAKVLQETIYEISPQVTGVIPRDMLLYYYYGGLVYIGLREWKKAASFLETCVTVPANALSAIAVEAYKKYILVALLCEGKLPPLPKHSPSVVRATIRRYCSEYTGLVSLWGTWKPGATKEISEYLQKHKKAFEEDKNWGLATQALQSATRQAVTRLTTTYDTLSLQAIADAVDLSSAKEAEDLVLQMVEREELSAQINERDGMVSFLDPEPTDLYQRLEATMESVKTMAARLEQLDESIQVSRDYNERQVSKDPSLREEMQGGRSQKKSMGMFQGLVDAFKG